MLECARLELPHPLGRNPKAATGLAERCGLVAVDAVAQLNHVALALGQPLQRAPHALLPQAHLHLLFGLRLVARDQLAERRLALLAHRLVEARDRAGGLAHLIHLPERKLGRLRHLLLSGRAPELRCELALRAGDLALALADVHGNADRARLVAEPA